MRTWPAATSAAALVRAFTKRACHSHLSRRWRSTQHLVPTFRSSCSIAAPTFTNFGKSWALANLLFLVPLYRSEVPDRIRRLPCRDFRSAVLGEKVLIFFGAFSLKACFALKTLLSFDAFSLTRTGAHFA